MSHTKQRTSLMKPRHKYIFAMDIASFGIRSEADQALLREAMYSIAAEASDTAKLGWRPAAAGDRGDGLLGVSKKVRPEVLVNDYPYHLADGVRRYNLRVAPHLQMRLRLAMDDGHVQKDRQGYSGKVITQVTRLLDAPAFKELMDARNLEFAVITSPGMYEVIRGYQLLDHRKVEEIQVEVKETKTTGWVWTP